MSERKFNTGDAFYLAAGRGLASTFFKSFADQFDQAYQIFGGRTEDVQATLINTVPQDVLDEVRNVFDDLAYDFTRRLAEMAGENDDDDPTEEACCGEQCEGHFVDADAYFKSAGIEPIEVRPAPAEAAGE